MSPNIASPTHTKLLTAPFILYTILYYLVHPRSRNVNDYRSTRRAPSGSPLRRSTHLARRNRDTPTGKTRDYPTSRRRTELG